MALVLGASLALAAPAMATQGPTNGSGGGTGDATPAAPCIIPILDVPCPPGVQLPPDGGGNTGQQGGSGSDQTGSGGGQETTPGTGQPAAPQVRHGRRWWRELTRRTFTMEADVVDAVPDASGDTGTVDVENADLLHARRYASVLDTGDVSVVVTARTSIQDPDGNDIGIGDLTDTDTLMVRGRFAPQARWVDNGDGTTTPVFIARMIDVEG
ncbi:MAG: hypothetical protein U0Y82_01100 [Thermoleophilia bacterium]